MDPKVTAMIAIAFLVCALAVHKYYISPKTAPAETQKRAKVSGDKKVLRYFGKKLRGKVLR